MGTSIGGAIDYLVAGINPVTSTTLLADLRAVDKVVILSDNMPVTESQSLVVIGRQGSQSGDAGSGTAAYQVMGAQRVLEAYQLDCYVQVYRDGPSQKPARDAALALFDAVVHWVHADPTMGSLLLQGRIGLVSSVDLQQTQDDEDTAGTDLRFAQVDFSLHIENHYVP